MKIGFVGQSYPVRSPAVGVQSDINLFVELIEDPNEKSKNIATFYGTPGYHLFKDFSTIDAGFTNMRGIWSGGGRVFAAGGTKYCEVDSAGSLVGSVRTISNTAVNGMSNSPVQFFPNGNSLFIVSGGLAYIDNGSGPTAITFATGFAGVCSTFAGQVVWTSGDKFDPGMVGGSITINAVVYTVGYWTNPEIILLTSSAGNQTDVAYSASAPALGAVTGGYLDGYYILSRPASRQYNISALNDTNGSEWDGLDFSTKNSQPDHLRSVLAGDDLYLFGTDSFDVHRNSGPTATSDFPFHKMDGASSLLGSCSPWGPIYINGRVFFVASSSNGRVVAYTLDGYTPVRISTHAEEYQWSAANLGTNAVSYTEEFQGHFFWVINFGTQTWVYDLTSESWAERKWWSGSAYTAAPIQYHTYIPQFGNGKHLVCGGASSKVYEASLDFYDFDGTDFKWSRTLPHIYKDGKMQYFGRMTLEMETGTTPSGTPVVTREWSDDRGQTFSHPETASIGTTGQFSIRVFWPSCSSSRDRVYRFSGTGQYKVSLISLDVEYRVGKT